MLTDNQRQQLNVTIDTLLWKLNRFRQMIHAYESGEEVVDDLVHAKTVARAEGLLAEIHRLRLFRDLGA